MPPHRPSSVSPDPGRQSFLRVLDRWHLIGLPSCVLLLAGCQHVEPSFTRQPALPAPSLPLETVTFTNQVNPALLQPPTDFYTLGPGDKLEIELMGETNAAGTTVVGPDGKIYFNLLPGLDVWGLTLAQAKAEIEREMSKYVREQPQVSLVLRGVESREVWILGRVQVPGVYPLATPMTVLEALSMAGGTLSLTSYRDQEAAGVGEELADLQHSFVLRQGKLMPVDFDRLLRQGDLSQNIYLQSDDLIYLPAATAREVYVLGAVGEPRAVPYHEGLTVAGAIAGAYGALKGSYINHVVVVRGSLSHPQAAVVNYWKVLHGEAQDMVLQPRDIVYVPLSPFRYISRYVQLAIDTFVGSAAINAGSAAVTFQPTTTSGVFIPIGSGIQIIPPVSVPSIR